jgi:hypothetical protein
MPESFFHSEVGVEVFQSVIEDIISQLYLPGTMRRNSGLCGGGSASTCLLFGFVYNSGQQLDDDTQKQPDFTVGFIDIENRPFLVGETGYSDSGTLTKTRVQDWIVRAAGEVLTFFMHHQLRIDKDRVSCQHC